MWLGAVADGKCGPEVKCYRKPLPRNSSWYFHLAPEEFLDASSICSPLSASGDGVINSNTVIVIQHWCHNHHSLRELPELPIISHVYILLPSCSVSYLHLYINFLFFFFFILQFQMFTPVCLLFLFLWFPFSHSLFNLLYSSPLDLCFEPLPGVLLFFAFAHFLDCCATLLILLKPSNFFLTCIHSPAISTEVISSVNFLSEVWNWKILGLVKIVKFLTVAMFN